MASLYAIAHAINSWLFFPLFWVAQGTMFWALFVIGHDCGHGSFSKHKWLNNLIGHITHTPILVPYHGWRISHRTHHANTGNIDTDESWYPISKQTYDGMDSSAKLLRFGFFLLAYPFYLFFPLARSSGLSFFYRVPRCFVLLKSGMSSPALPVLHCLLGFWSGLALSLARCFS